MSYEIIKIDAELAECNKTGDRYFGYVKYRDATGNVYWQDLSGIDIPWHQSIEHVIYHLEGHDFPEVLQVVILKAELPLKKLILDDD